MLRPRRALTALAAAVALCAGTLALAGCSADPDTSGLEAELGGVDGVNGAFVWTTHPNAPWVTHVQVMLFLDDPSETGVVDAVRAAAPVLAADGAAASADAIGLTFVDGQRSDYASRGEAGRDVVAVTPDMARELGVADVGKRQLQATPAAIRALVEAE